MYNSANPLELDQRKQKILQGVVWCYVETAEPVGSESLAARYSDWGVKAATIRNTLADLADLGYLRQPHTSAGRIPSDQGYRFYVNYLIDEREPDSETAERAKAELAAERTASLDRILHQTCALLTQMTRYTSVATRPRPTDTNLRQVFTTVAGPDAVVVMALTTTGQTLTRMLSASDACLASAEPGRLEAATNAVNQRFSGLSMQMIGSSSDDTAPADLTNATARALYAAIADAVRQMARRACQENPVVEGAREILRQPEFHDVAKLGGVLEALQTETQVAHLFTMAQKRDDVTVVIGSENPVEALRDCAVVTAPYYAGPRECGALAVIGPTRMSYDQTLPAVSFMARSLSSVLSGL